MACHTVGEEGFVLPTSGLAGFRATGGGSSVRSVGIASAAESLAAEESVGADRAASDPAEDRSSGTSTSSSIQRPAPTLNSDRGSTKSRGTSNRVSGVGRISHAIGMSRVLSFTASPSVVSKGAFATGTRTSGLRNSGDMTEEVRDLVSFGVAPEILRASPLSLLMRRGGAIFASKVGTAETYALSEQVTHIDVFISHNWAVSRTKKFLSLALHFNLSLALVSSVVALGLMAAAVSLGVRIAVVDSTPLSAFDASMGTVEHSWGCSVVVAPVILLVALFGTELQRLVGVRGQMAFLDKTCIHQSDKNLQMTSIRKLGAFVRASSSMVVPYTDIYLMRLWTVYEVACFLSLHPSSKLLIVPTYQPVVVFGGIIIAYVSTSLGMLLPRRLEIVAKAITYCFAAVSTSVFLRRSAREKEDIRQRVAHFQVDTCVCAVDEDRPVVQRNIAVFMRATGHVDSHATEREALDAFDIAIRRNLSRSITASIGPVGVSYRQTLAMLIPLLVPQCVDVSLLGTLSNEEEWILRYRICFAVYWATWTLGLMPLIVAWLSAMCSSCLHLRNAREGVFIIAFSLQTLLCGLVVQVATSRLAWASVLPGRYRGACTAGQVALLPLATLTAIYIFTRGRYVVADELDDDEVAEEAQPQWASSQEQPDVYQTAADIFVAEVSRVSI